MYRVESPLDTVRVEIAEPRLLKLDDKGGLHLRLDVGDAPGETRRQARARATSGGPSARSSSK